MRITATLTSARYRFGFSILSRDKSDTLLLLTACTMVLLPHFGHLPWWISTMCGSLLSWRGWITLRGLRLPRMWILLPLALFSMGAVYAYYRMLLGRDVGVAMLTLLLTFKLLEMKARRDLFVVLLLSFFLLLTTFFYSQSIATTLMMLATLIVILTAQLSFHYTGTVPSLRKRLCLGASILAMALPLTLILFLLFPRIQGPLWGLPSDAHSGRSGLSDSMAPGNISQLALSDDIAFRVQFADSPPHPAKLYWRGTVLSNFDGRNWTRNQTQNVTTQSVPVRLTTTRPVRQRITMEPSNQRWLFALETPDTAPILEENKSRITSDYQILATSPIRERIRYEVTSHLDTMIMSDATPMALRQAITLPPNYNPRTQAFATALRTQWNNDSALVNAVLRYFRTGNFDYTLAPPLLGRNSVDDFLFSSRAGFCEHYTSAFVVLMRAAHIPARVVTGYQGGEINPVDNLLTVRQSDAHAWAEVWLPPRGWIRIDPTAAVAPGRIQTQLSQLLPRSIMGGFITFRPGQNGWWSQLNLIRANWEALTSYWNQWILSYTPDQQKGFLRWLGITNIDWHTMTALMFVMGVMAVGIVTLPLFLRTNKTKPLDKLYSAFCTRMARHGLVRKMHEGPRTYRQRLCAEQSPLTADNKIAIQHFIELYEIMQYGAIDNIEGSTDNTPPAPLMTKLKLLLSQCR